MLPVKFFAEWGKDWTGRMSGLASILLTFWATFFPPTADAARYALLASAIACFILGSYHIWVRERRALLDERAKQALPVAAPLSAAERMREHFPAIREVEETARTRPLTPGEEMAYAVNVAHAL